MKISLVIGFDSLLILYIVSTWNASQGAQFGGNPSIEFFVENLQNLLAKSKSVVERRTDGAKAQKHKATDARRHWSSFSVNNEQRNVERKGYLEITLFHHVQPRTTQ